MPYTAALCYLHLYGTRGFIPLPSTLPAAFYYGSYRRRGEHTRFTFQHVALPYHLPVACHRFALPPCHLFGYAAVRGRGSRPPPVNQDVACVCVPLPACLLCVHVHALPQRFRRTPPLHARRYTYVADDALPHYACRFSVFRRLRLYTRTVQRRTFRFFAAATPRFPLLPLRSLYGSYLRFVTFCVRIAGCVCDGVWTFTALHVVATPFLHTCGFRGLPPTCLLRLPTAAV